ncbi:hypothetical protein [Streptomyces sp. NPDC001675]
MVQQADSTTLRPLTKAAFDEACNNRGQARGATLVGTGSDAYSIRCVNDDGSADEFDRPEQIHQLVSEACQLAYPGVSEIDRLATMGETYTGWECATFAGYAGSPDLEGWCKAKGLDLINREDVKYPAYKWFCAHSGNSGFVGISVQDVCKWQYGENALDRVSNVYGEEIGDAWDCFYVK